MLIISDKLCGCIIKGMTDKIKTCTTDLLYMNDFNVETCNAKVLNITNIDDNRVDIILDQTCFYPRGGGQDWDLGTISNGNVITNIEEVHLDSEGVVHHICYKTDLSIGDNVSCQVDHARRQINSRLHSAGHLIDMAIRELDLDWVATKGQHYPHLSAVEYTGTWDPEKADEVRSSIEAKVNKLGAIEQDNRLVQIPVNELKSVCANVPENIPSNKPCRVVVFGDSYFAPCGGTHVKNLNDIGVVEISKLKCKKGVIRINYIINTIN